MSNTFTSIGQTVAASQGRLTSDSLASSQSQADLTVKSIREAVFSATEKSMAASEATSQSATTTLSKSNADSLLVAKSWFDAHATIAATAFGNVETNADVRMAVATGILSEAVAAAVSLAVASATVNVDTSAIAYAVYTALSDTLEASREQASALAAAQAATYKAGDVAVTARFVALTAGIAEARAHADVRADELLEAVSAARLKVPDLWQMRIHRKDYVMSYQGICTRYCLCFQQQHLLRSGGGERCIRITARSPMLSRSDVHCGMGVYLCVQVWHICHTYM